MRRFILGKRGSVWSKAWRTFIIFALGAAAIGALPQGGAAIAPSSPVILDFAKTTNGVVRGSIDHVEVAAITAQGKMSLEVVGDARLRDFNGPVAIMLCSMHARLTPNCEDPVKANRPHDAILPPSNYADAFVGILRDVYIGDVVFVYIATVGNEGQGVWTDAGSFVILPSTIRNL